MKLTQKFSLLVCLITFIFISSITLFLVVVRSGEIKQDLIQKDKIVAQILLHEFGEGFSDYYFYQYDSYKDIVRKTFQNYPDVLYFRMYNPEGKLLFDSDRLNEPRGSNPLPLGNDVDPFISSLITSQQTYADMGMLNGLQTIRVVDHFVDKYDIPRNTFEFYFSISKIREVIRNMILLYLVMLTVSISLSIIATVVIVRQIIKPIELLTVAANQFASGNINYSFQVTSTDEVGILASAFTKMVADLKTSRKNLEDQNERLELEVHKRTKELQTQIDEMSKLQKLTIDRELTMVEMKKELSALKK